MSVVIAAKSKQQLKQKVFCSKTSCSCTVSHVQVEGGKSKVNVPFYGRLSTLMLFNYYLQWFLMLCKMLMRADAMCMYTAQTRMLEWDLPCATFAFLISHTLMSVLRFTRNLTKHCSTRSLFMAWVRQSALDSWMRRNLYNEQCELWKKW